MKELFKTTIDIFKKNKYIWTLAILVYCLIMTIGLGLSLLIGIGNLLVIIFVACPFIFTFIKLSIKGVDNLPSNEKDVYLGYKDLSRSIFISLRKFLVPVLLSLLAYVICFFGLTFVYIYLFQMDLVKEIIDKVSNIQNITNNELSMILLNNEEFMQNILYLNYISLGITIIFFNIIANKKIFSIIFFMCLNTTQINYEYIVNNKKELKKHKIILYNIFISLFYVVGLILAIIANTLLINALDNVIISYLISAFVFFSISALVIPFKYIAYTHLFNKYFNKDVAVLYEELMNKNGI